MKFKKIIGLDTSTNLTGIGIITYDSKHKMSVKSTSINLKNQGHFSDAKFKNMVMAIYDVIKNEKPDVIVIEDNCVEGSNANMNPFYARKLKNLIGSCMAIGYIKTLKSSCTVLLNGVQLSETRPRTWTHTELTVKHGPSIRLKKFLI